MTDIRAPTTATWPICLTNKSTRNRTSRDQIQDRVQISCAMALLHAGVDTSVIALWLGHESAETTQIYLHADMTIKERALARIAQPGGIPGRYTPPDTLLTFLQTL